MATTTQILPLRYRQVQLIARGAMGDIYRATDTALGRTVAVKTLVDRYADDPDVRRRFEREARTAARLSAADYVVAIFDVGSWNERPYLVMEYLEGGSLADRLSAATPKLGLALQWLEQTARALSTAHRAGIVHRDIKPANILLDRQENVRVADFGIARALELDSLTTAGTVLGTAGYLAPEQARGEPATPASDCYALGVVAFELLTGRRPFERRSPVAEANAHIQDPPPSPRSLRPDLPEALDAVFAKALAKHPDDRYSSPLDFVRAIRDALRESAAETAVLPPANQTPTTLPQARRSQRRGRWRRLALLAALAAAAVAGLVAGLLLSEGSTRVRTLTIHGKVVHQTVTAPAPPPAPPPPAAHPPSPRPSVTPPPAVDDPHTLNDRGYSLMKRGEWETALPLLQSAVRGLAGRGPGDPYEAYANYNLGYTLVQIHRCAESLPYLHRADRLEPGNSDVHAALARATRCL